MTRSFLNRVVGIFLLSGACVSPVFAQAFRVQCPESTVTHPAATNDSEPAYSGATKLSTGANGYQVPAAGTANGAIKCQQVSGGDGYSTMADGTVTYMFSFGPLSGVYDISQGQPGTQFPSVFNTPYADSNGAIPAGSALPPGYPAQQPGTPLLTNYNGAIGLANDVVNTFTIYDISKAGHVVTVVLNEASPYKVGDTVVIGQGVGNDLNGYTGTFVVTAVNINNAFFAANYAFKVANPSNAVLAEVTNSSDATASYKPGIDGHVDAKQIIDVGVMNGNIPAPLIAIDEDDELFLTLTNVGMIMRPDLFEQHTIHFHGYPNASSIYDGVPDASVAITIGGSFTYYYLAPDAGTYFWHCHITPPEHLQMGMVGQLYVRPRQNRYVGALLTGLKTQQGDLRTACSSATDVLCSNPLPVVATGATNNGSKKYAYNDGDGSTYYDVEYPIQMHGFDPNFHFVGMTFNPEGFADMKDKYFLLNGRSYPDTAQTGPMQTPSSDGVGHFSQPLPTIINVTAGQRALLRISQLSVSEYHTLASLAVPMTVVGLNAKLLRDQAGNNLAYMTNSITLGGGESLDAILDTCTVTRADPSTACPTGAAMPKGTYYLYTSNLDHLSNDAENFGGEMAEVHVN